jgi:uncharacterized membrane protein
MKIPYPIVFALLTALFWGLYGPILGKARAIDASPFKPYVAIGVAYLIIAIFGGLIGMYYKGDSFTISGAGAKWGLIAGTLGAFGALTLTLAMFTGGTNQPQVVMPIVFGGAVTVTAFYAILTSGGKMHASPMLWVGVVLMLVSVVIITMNTPHAAPAPPTQSTSASAPKTAIPTAQPGQES